LPHELVPDRAGIYATIACAEEMTECHRPDDLPDLDPSHSAPDPILMWQKMGEYRAGAD
jgi:hypothetical protein